TPQVAKESSYAPEDRLLRAILGIQVSTYLQDGRPVDMVFNPLGVPSRMNVRMNVFLFFILEMVFCIDFY
ncbi:hypothetical protein Gotri_015104, partial [Gossypium trilobum]|nr:hypothetical protein [Gossypium trilobum]